LLSTETCSALSSRKVTNQTTPNLSAKVTYRSSLLIATALTLFSEVLQLKTLQHNLIQITFSKCEIHGRNYINNINCKNGIIAMEQTTGSKNTDTTNLKAIVLVPILLFAMRAEEQSVAYIVWMQRHESVFQTFTSLSSPADANKAPLTLKQIALIASE